MGQGCRFYMRGIDWKLDMDLYEVSQGVRVRTVSLNGGRGKHF